MKVTLQGDKNFEVEVAQKPTEGKYFEVNPQAIDQKLFEKERTDKSQEKTRQFILEAFIEMKCNPEKYGRKFMTIIPKRDWETTEVAQLVKIICKYGDHNADWVEQALEWAQRIANGESWEAICNEPDTANYYRIVLGKNGYSGMFVGGCGKVSDYRPASNILGKACTGYYWLRLTVPLIVRYV